MSLQDIIDWWNNYSKEKKKVVSCGAWPAAVPPWVDIFLSCCADHDKEYSDSELMYATGVLEQDKNLKDRALELKEYADQDFIKCVRARYRQSSFLTRFFTKLWGEQYIAIVLANGDRIWFHSIGVIIAEFESGDHAVIEKALQRAQTHGTENEEEIIRKAHSKARGSETRH